MFLTSSLALLDVCTWPPTTNTGFFADDKIFDTSTTFSGKANGGLILILFTSSISTFASNTSVGIAITTGPGMPLSAIWKALAVTFAISLGVLICSTCLAMSENVFIKSISCKCILPVLILFTCPINRTIGTPPWCAEWTEIEAFVAPGPLLTNATPALPVHFASATAINPAPPSCLQVTTSIPGEYNNSSITDKYDSPGTQKNLLTPWFFKVWTKTEAAFLAII